MNTSFPDLSHFLNEVPTSWHAVDFLSRFLSKNGHKELNITKPFVVSHGEEYFVRKGGALFTFSLPKKKVKRLLLFATHTDSPTYMVKRHPDCATSNMNSLLLEPYGGPIHRTWIDRDLFLAGKIFSTQGDKLQERLISLEDHPFTIPSLAIHLDRDQKTPENKQIHLRPLFSLGAGKTLESLLKKQCKGETLHSFELLLVPCEPARILQSDMLASYRLDNIASVHATVEGLLNAKKSEDTLVCHAMFNHEEIGSATAEGGLSHLLQDLLVRVAHALYNSPIPLAEWKANGFGVSVDMAHALHPNHTNKYDEQNAPLLGEGVAIKHNASKKYATSAYSASYIEHIAKKAKVPVQHFTSHSDATCGSTIGHFLSYNFGMEVVDLGIPQLAMHSARELISLKDHHSLSKLVRSLA